VQSWMRATTVSLSELAGNDRIADIPDRQLRGNNDRRWIRLL
jgi:hypothetical protein